MIRPATLADVRDILAVAEEQAARYPLKQDKSKMQSLITQAISSPKDYAWVDVDERGKLRAVIVAFTLENLWAQRKAGHVVLWWSNTPGKGANLLRRFATWVKSRRAIKVAGFSVDLDLPERTYQLMERLGFKRHGGAYLLYN